MPTSRLVEERVHKPVAVRLPDFGACVIESRHAPGFAPRGCGTTSPSSSS